MRSPDREKQIEKPRGNLSIFNEIRKRSDLISSNTDSTIESSRLQAQLLRPKQATSDILPQKSDTKLPSSKHITSTILPSSSSYTPFISHSYPFHRYNQNSFGRSNAYLNYRIVSPASFYGQHYYPAFNFDKSQTEYALPFYSYSHTGMEYQPESIPTEHFLAFNNEEYAENLIQLFECNNCDLRLLSGKIAKLACFQNGSRYLQKKIAENNSNFIQFVFSEVFNFLVKKNRLRTSL